MSDGLGPKVAWVRKREFAASLVAWRSDHDGVGGRGGCGLRAGGLAKGAGDLTVWGG